MMKTIRDKLLEGIASGPPVLADDAYVKKHGITDVLVEPHYAALPMPSGRQSPRSNASSTHRRTKRPDS